MLLVAVLLQGCGQYCLTCGHSVMISRISLHHFGSIELHFYFGKVFLT